MLPVFVLSTAGVLELTRLRDMSSDRVHAALPDPPRQPEDNPEEEKAAGNIFAELESVDLPLGTTLR